MRKWRKAAGAALSVLLIFCMAADAFAEDVGCMEPFMMTVYADDSASPVRAYHADYINNIYLSLSDVAMALSGTAKQFSLLYGNTKQDGEYFSVKTGEEYTAVAEGIIQQSVEERESVWLVFKRNRLFVDGTEKKYYTYKEGGNDLFVNLTDLQLMMDLPVEAVSPEAIRIGTSGTFSPDYDALLQSGFFTGVNSYIAGDADTYSAIYAVDPYSPFPIASTSKLMTYVLVQEAIERGEFSEQSVVTLSANAQRISEGANGIVPMEEGTEVTVAELLQAMLVASSNESATALAEFMCGTEEEFVVHMNERAQQFGLETAQFYTSNGLPVYTAGLMPGKVQNLMSTEDLFSLSAYVLQKYPQITAITGQSYASLTTLKYTTANSNPLVFNMPGVNGLKTGSTTGAGYCLIATKPLTVKGVTHNIMVILLGSETAADRGRQAEVLMRCTEEYYRAHGFAA